MAAPFQRVQQAPGLSFVGALILRFGCAQIHRCVAIPGQIIDAPNEELQVIVFIAARGQWLPAGMTTGVLVGGLQQQQIATGFGDGGLRDHRCGE